MSIISVGIIIFFVFIILIQLLDVAVSEAAEKVKERKKK